MGVGVGLPSSDILFKLAEDLKAALVEMAKSRLAQSVGDRYRDIVLNCLTCLDKDNPDFADKAQFSDETGMCFERPARISSSERVSFGSVCRTFERYSGGISKGVSLVMILEEQVARETESYFTKTKRRLSARFGGRQINQSDHSK